MILPIVSVLVAIALPAHSQNLTAPNNLLFNAEFDDLSGFSKWKPDNFCVERGMVFSQGPFSTCENNQCGETVTVGSMRMTCAVEDLVTHQAVWYSENFTFQHGIVEWSVKIPGGQDQGVSHSDMNLFASAGYSSTFFMGLVPASIQLNGTARQVLAEGAPQSVVCLFKGLLNCGSYGGENATRHHGTMFPWPAWKPDFNNITVLWSPERIEFYLNGHIAQGESAKVASSYVPKNPMRLFFLMQTLGMRESPARNLTVLVDHVIVKPLHGA